MNEIDPIIKVAMADDHKIFRRGVILSLRKYDNIKFVQEANNGQELIDGIELTQPEVILMDLKMPVKDGIETTKYINKHFPSIKILILTMYDDERFVSHLMDHGARGYLLKSTEPAEIKKAISDVMRTGFYVNNFVNKTPAKKNYSGQKFNSNLNSEVVTSEREKEVLTLVAMEYTVPEIAQKMNISARTVEAIKDRLMARFGVKNSLGLVFYARKNGLLNNEDYLNVMKNKIFTVSNEQIIMLFSLSTSILKYINHDLNGQKGSLHFILQAIREELNQKESHESNISNYIEVNNLIESAFNVIDEIGLIANAIKSHFYWQTSDKKKAFNKLFISQPAKIVKNIQQRFKNVNIEIHRTTLRSLEIIYPPNIFLYILLELTENAKKATTSNLEILIRWKIKGKIFQCEVHDNGPGFPGLKQVKFVPLGSLVANVETNKTGMGLGIINRTMLDSGGHLFFSHSKLLNGAMVYFEFPVIDFKYKTFAKNGKE